VVPVVVGYRVVGIGTGRDGGTGGVLVDEWKVAVMVRVVNAVEFGQGDRLNGGVALLGAEIEVFDGLFTIQSVEQLPGGIGQIEEGLAVGGDEKALVVADLERGQGLGASDGQSQTK
jgi:hypothetical protein